MQILPLRKFTAVTRILAAFLLAVAVAMFRVISIGADVPVPLGPSPLPYTTSYLVTGDFASTTLDLVQTTEGKLRMSGVPKDADILAAFMYVEAIHVKSQKAKDVFAGATFRNQPLTSVRTKAFTQPLSGPTSACYSSNTPLAMTIYRADVLKLLPRQLDKSGKPTGKLLVNDADLPQTQKLLFRLPDIGGNSGQQFAGATLVVVYRDPAPTAPLRKIVVNDGLYILGPGEEPELKIGGFYSSDPLNKRAKVMVLGGAGQKNTTDSLLLNGGVIKTDPFVASSSSSDRSVSGGVIDVSSRMPGTVLGNFGETVTMKITHGKTSPYECIALEATWFSTTVPDRDADGKPDRLEQPGGPLRDPDGELLPDLYAMGARDNQKDALFEFMALRTTDALHPGGTTYGSAAAPYDSSANPPVPSVTAPAHNHMPPSDVITKFVEALAVGGIKARVDVGDPALYHALGPEYTALVGPGDSYLLPQHLARGGELEEEAACNPVDRACHFPDYPGTLGWGFSLQKFLLGPSGKYADSLRFDPKRAGLFYVGVHVHTRGKPRSLPCFDQYGNLTLYDSPNSTTCAYGNNPPYSPSNPTGWRPQDYRVPTSSAGAGALPGHQFITALGRWENYVGKPISRLTAILHEWGHNAGLWHGGASARLVYDNAGVVKVIQDNCKANYLSIMSYLFQGDGVKDLANKGHAVLSGAANQTVSESTLKDFSILAGGGVLPYRTAWFAPLNQGGLVDTLGKPATKLCNGLPFPGGTPIAMGRFDSLTLSANIDWATNGFVLNQSAAGQDVNLDNEKADVMDGFNDWANIRLNQGGSGHIMGGAISMGGSDFGGSDFGGSDFGGSDFGGSDFGGSDFGGSDFGGSDFGGSDFGGIDLDGSDFGGSDFGGSDFGGNGFAGDAEITHEDVVALGNNAPAEVFACVIRSTQPLPARPGFGEPACDPSVLGQAHRTRLTWKAPEILPDPTTMTNPVTFYHIFRTTPTQSVELATLDPTQATCASLDEVCEYFDNQELADGLQVTYSVKADFNNRPSSNAAHSTIVTRNDTPVAVADAFSINEDPLAPLTGNVLANNGFGADSDPDSPLLPPPPPPGDGRGPQLVAPPSNGTLTFNDTGTFSYSPNADFYGTDTFTYKIVSGTFEGQKVSPDSNTATVTITVNPVNDRPSFAKGADDTVAEDSGPRTVTGWATSISAGPANETIASCPPFAPPVCNQTVSFQVTNNNAALFSVAPAVASNGTLTYTPAPDANGTAEVTVVAKDTGGTANGGFDTSAPPQAFFITVTPVNDAPVPVGDSKSAFKNAPLVFPATDLTGNDSAGPPDENPQTLNVTEVNTAVNGSVTLEGGSITFTPAAGFTGTASFIYKVCDNGTTNGAADPQCATATVTVTVRGRFAIVASELSNEVTVIDLDTTAVTTTLAEGINLLGASVTPDGDLGVVADFDGSGTLRLINLAVEPATSAGTITVPAIPYPESTAITPDGQYAIVSDGNPAVPETDVVSVNLQTGAVVNTVSDLPGNQGVAITPDGTHVLVLSAPTNQVSVLTISPAGVLADTGQRVSIEGSGLSRSIVITPNGNLALVTSTDGLVNVLQLVAGAWVQVDAIGGLGTSPSGIAITPDGSRAYVSSFDGSHLAVLTITDGVVADSGLRIAIPAGTPNTFFGVPGLAVTPDGTRLFISSYNSDVVTILNTSDNTVMTTIAVGDGPAGIGMPPP